MSHPGALSHDSSSATLLLTEQANQFYVELNSICASVPSDECVTAEAPEVPEIPYSNAHASKGFSRKVLQLLNSSPTSRTCKGLKGVKTREIWGSGFLQKILWVHWESDPSQWARNALPSNPMQRAPGEPDAGLNSWVTVIRAHLWPEK